MRLFAIAFFMIGCAGNTASTKEATDKAAKKAPEAQEVSSETEAATDSDKTRQAPNVTLALRSQSMSPNPLSALSNRVHLRIRRSALPAITDVCQKKGCWMVIEDNGYMRVLMKDHAFAVDMNATGKTCDVEGVIIAKQENPAETSTMRPKVPGTVIQNKTKG